MIIIMVAPEIAISVEVISTVTGVVIGTAIGTTIGTVAGAVQSIPEDKAGEMEARLKAILAEDHPHEKLRFSVINGAAKLGVQDVSEIAAGTPAVSGQGIDYWQLSGAKIDTILKVGLVSVSLSGSGGTDPDIFLNFSAVARLEDAKHKVELSRHNVTCQTEPRKFSEWNADGGSIIKEDIERAYRSLGKSIVNEIFLIESAKGESKRC
ncbi:MAG: hypothetical protein OEV08_10790 [Nitrospira sp.]|nr:hypothetical protein [Nitrospira sp.]